MSPRQRDCKRNVYDVALIGSSAQIPIVQKMTQEFFNGKEQRFAELSVLPSTYTETVFADELGRQDYVTGEMWNEKSPFRLAVNIASF